MAEDNTGKERENGYGKPPTEHQFKNGNTASNGVRNGKGPGIVKELKKLMREVVKGDPEGRTGRRFFSQALFKAACKGNGTAIREILERLEGKVPDAMDIGGTLHIRPSDFDEYTDEELYAIREIGNAAAARRGKPDSSA